MENAGTSNSNNFHFALNRRMLVKMTVTDGTADWKLNVELKHPWKFGVPHVHIVFIVTNIETERQAEKPAVV
jgi:hypothetical protein